MLIWRTVSIYRALEKHVWLKRTNGGRGIFSYLRRIDYANLRSYLCVVHEHSGLSSLRKWVLVIIIRIKMKYYFDRFSSFVNNVYNLILKQWNGIENRTEQETIFLATEKNCLRSLCPRYSLLSYGVLYLFLCFSRMKISSFDKFSVTVIPTTINHGTLENTSADSKIVP